MDLTSGKKLLTLADVSAMFDQGMLAPDDRLELIEGEILFMESPGPKHSAMTTEVHEILVQLLRGRAQVRSQEPIILDDHSVPRPDLAVVRYRRDYYAGAHPIPSDALCLIEVSDTTLSLDQRRKAPLYAKKDIPEMWIFNLRKQVLEVYRQPGPAGYRSVSVLRPGERVAIEALPDLEMEVSTLLASATR